MLTVITGPMFSGKTSKLISISISHVIAGRYVMAFKPNNDTRYDPLSIVSHTGQKLAAIVIDKEDPGKMVERALQYADEGNPLDVIAIEEAQFFNKKKFIELIDELVYGARIDVVMSGLSQDSRGKPFGAMPYCLAIADDIVHLKAVCSRTKRIGMATRTYRKQAEGGQTLVGGAELYEPRSFESWEPR